MTITPITPPTVAPVTVDISPITFRGTVDVQPFTYRSGMTYTALLESIRVWLTNTLVPYLNTNFEDITDSWPANSAAITDAVNTALAEQDTATQTALSEALTEIANASIPISDPIIAAAMATVGSQSKVFLDSNYTPQVVGQRVVVSTDWYTDCDDVGALRILSKYHRDGVLEVAAVVVDTTSPYGAPSLDAFLRAEGTPLQIGQVKGSASDLNSLGAYQVAFVNSPHYGVTAADYPDSTTVLRTVLANSPNNSVVVIGIGYETALADLLSSPADSISSLTGTQLVAAKVAHTYIMGGQYPSGTENNFSRSAQSKAAASTFLTSWPAPTGWTNSNPPYITFTGWEVGGTVPSGGNLANSVPSTDLVYTAYALHGNVNGQFSWDPMVAHIAAMGGAAAAGYSTVRGTNTLNSSTGANSFAASSTGPHEYVTKTLSDAQYAALVSGLLVPGRDPIRPNPNARYRHPTPSVPQVVGKTDIGAPVLALKASDLALTDGAAVPYTTPVGSTTSAFTTQAGNVPTFAAAKSGLQAGSTVSKAAIAFTGNQWLQSTTQYQANDWTVYARVLWGTLPTANQGIVSRDSQANQLRDIHLAGIPTGTAQAVAFNGSSAVVATKTGLVAGTWHLLVLRKDSNGVEVFIDGVSSGVAAGPTVANSGLVPFLLGASYLTGAAGAQVIHEGLTGWIAETRVYQLKHTDAQVATYSAQLV